MGFPVTVLIDIDGFGWSGFLVGKCCHNAALIAVIAAPMSSKKRSCSLPIVPLRVKFPSSSFNWISSAYWRYRFWGRNLWVVSVHIQGVVIGLTWCRCFKVIKMCSTFIETCLQRWFIVFVNCLLHDLTFFNVFVYCGTIMFKCVRYIFIYDIKFCYSVIWVSLPFLSFSVADLGEGPRGAAPLIFRANRGLKGRTNLFLETAPLPAFLFSRSRSGTAFGIKNCDNFGHCNTFDCLYSEVCWGVYLLELVKNTLMIIIIITINNIHRIQSSTYCAATTI